MMIGTLALLLIASAQPPGPAARVTSASAADRCANYPAAFAARSLSPAEERAQAHIRDAGTVKVTGTASAFEVHGRCDRLIADMFPTFRLRNGRWIISSGPPFELLPTTEPDTSGSYQTGDLSSVPARFRTIAAPDGSRLRLGTIVGLPAGRRLGLWSSGKAAMIGILTCRNDGGCAVPEPLIRIAHPAPEMWFLPSPDRTGSGGLSVWTRTGTDRDAVLSFRLSY